MPEPTIPTSLRWPPDLWEKLTKEARKQNISFNQLVIKLCTLNKR